MKNQFITILDYGDSLRLVEADKLPISMAQIEDYVEVLSNIIRNWSTPPIRLSNGEPVDQLDVKIVKALKAIGVRFIPVIDEDKRASQTVSLDELGVWDSIVNTGPRVYESVVELVARDNPTPLVKLKSLSTGKLRVWAKLEWYHPFSLSIKDRVSWFMLKNAVESGLLSGDKKLYEATSTNTGLGLAGLANYYGLKLRVYLPSTTQKCIDYLFTALGVEVVRKDTPMTTTMLRSVILDAYRDGAIVLNQYENDLNFIVHLQYTAKEIDYQLKSIGARPTMIISGLGTSGHLSALAFYFKSKYRDVKVYGVQPREGEVIPGLRRIEHGMKWLGIVEIDDVIEVSLREAFDGVLSIARGDGLLVGLSAGAVAYATRRLVNELELMGDAVVIIPDHGVKYIELMQSLITSLCPDTPYTG